METATRMSRIVIQNKTVYLCGQVATETNEGIVAQTKSVLDKVDSLLDQAGSSKDHIHPVLCQHLPIAARHPRAAQYITVLFWSVMVLRRQWRRAAVFAWMPAVGVGRLGNIGKIGFKALWHHCQEDQKGPLIVRGEHSKAWSRLRKGALWKMRRFRNSP